MSSEANQQAVSAVPPLSIRRGSVHGARQVPSPNFGMRPGTTTVDLVVVHNISLPPGEFGGGYVDALFCNRLNPVAHPYFSSIYSLQVSAHLLIDRRGGLTQYVNLLNRAWHAGVSQYRGRTDCNDFSIGIELEGCDELPFAEPQYRSLIALLGVICVEFPAITAQRIVGHSDIAPGRKTDPGPHFDWVRLRSALGTAASGIPGE